MLLFEFNSLWLNVVAKMSRLYVGRLPNSAREKDVEKFFKGYGKISEIVLKNGYGFVVSNWDETAQFKLLCVLQIHVPVIISHPLSQCCETPAVPSFLYC